MCVIYFAIDKKKLEWSFKMSFFFTWLMVRFTSSVKCATRTIYGSKFLYNNAVIGLSLNPPPPSLLQRLVLDWWDSVCSSCSLGFCCTLTPSCWPLEMWVFLFDMLHPSGCNSPSHNRANCWMVRLTKDQWAGEPAVLYWLSSAIKENRVANIISYSKRTSIQTFFNQFILVQGHRVARAYTQLQRKVRPWTCED